MHLRILAATVFVSILCLLAVGCGTQVQRCRALHRRPPRFRFKAQPFQRPENCLPCHQRQYDELHSAVKSGYRNVSPLFNGLESAANLVSGGLLRPVYQDSTIVLPDGTTLNTNMYTSPILTETRQVQAGFCFTCHNANVEVLGEDPTKREVPQLAGLGANPSEPQIVPAAARLRDGGLERKSDSAGRAGRRSRSQALCRRWGLRELPATFATMKTGRTLTAVFKWMASETPACC